MVSCKGNGPELTVCLIDAERQEMQCGKADGTQFVIPITSATNYVCLSPDEFSTLLSYMREKCK